MTTHGGRRSQTGMTRDLQGHRSYGIQYVHTFVCTLNTGHEIRSLRRVISLFEIPCRGIFMSKILYRTEFCDSNGKSVPHPVYIRGRAAGNGRLIGLFYRRFHHCSPELLLTLYKSFIRPHLEYAPQVWDPHLVKDIDLLEKTQKFALRVCCKDWSAPYCDLLDRCQLSSLSSRRRTAKLCHLYKVIYRLVDCENAPVAHRALQYSCRRSNQAQIQTLFAQSSQYQFSFYPHSISLWNSLVINNESLSSLATFKYFTTVVM